MNICFYHHSEMNPLRGGIKRVSVVLGDEFAGRGDSVFYLARSADDGCRHNSGRQFFLSDISARETASPLELFLSRNKIDIFVFQDGDDCEVFSPEVFKKLRIPLVCCVHNDPLLWQNLVYAKFFRKYGQRFVRCLAWFVMFKIFLKGRKFIRIFRRNTCLADATVLLSERFIPSYLRMVYSADWRKIFAIPNPSPFSSQAVDFFGKRKELLFVGRMDNGQKCTDVLLSAWGKLQKAFPNWSLRFVGDGKDLKIAKKTVSEKKIERVFFEGRQKPESYYRSASIFCMTSAYEGFPMVLVEAAAFGCVPVAFDSFVAVHDIISDGETGCLVPAFDVDKYAETLANLMRNDELRVRLAQNALSRIPEKFSPKKIGDAWEKLFGEVIREAKNEIRGGKR